MQSYKVFVSKILHHNWNLYSTIIFCHCEIFVYSSLLIQTFSGPENRPSKRGISNNHYSNFTKWIWKHYYHLDDDLYSTKELQPWKYILCKLTQLNSMCNDEQHLFYMKLVFIKCVSKWLCLCCFQFIIKRKFWFLSWLMTTYLRIIFETEGNWKVFVIEMSLDINNIEI